MDIDVMARKVADLLIANQNMGAQIAELDHRLSALEPKTESEEPKPDEAVDPAADQKPAGETQDAPPLDPAPTPAADAAEASPEPPHETDKP